MKEEMKLELMKILHTPDKQKIAGVVVTMLLLKESAAASELIHLTGPALELDPRPDLLETKRLQLVAQHQLMLQGSIDVMGAVEQAVSEGGEPPPPH